MTSDSGRRFGYWIRGAAILLASSGAAICLLWFGGAQDATRLVAESSFVQFVTALVFVALAFTLWHLSSGKFRLAAWSGGAVLAIGVITLVEYFTGWDLVLDHAFPASPPSAFAPFPGRMAANSAVAVSLAAAAAIILAAGRRIPWVPAVASMLASLVVAIGAIALIGYAIDLGPAVEWVGLSRMALVTAVLFVVTGLALGAAALELSGAASAYDPPWAPMSVGIGAAAVALLAWRALNAEHPGAGWGSNELILGLGLVVAALLTGSVAQTRHLRLQSNALSAAHAAIKLANESLTQAFEQRQIFAALVENSSDFIGIADPQGKPIYVNPAGKQMIGLPADLPVESTAIPEYYAADQKEFAANVIVPAMIERGHWRGETAFRNWQTGAAIPVSDEHFMIRDSATNRILGMGTVTRDVSDIRRAQELARLAAEKLRDSHEEVTRLYQEKRALSERLGEERDHLAEAQAAGHIGSWEYDLDTGAATWSEEKFRILGLQPGSCTASRETLMRRVHPDDRERVARAYAELVAGSESCIVDYRILLPDGSTRHVHEQGRLARGISGRPERSIGTIQDVTERHLAEESMRQAATVFTATNEGIVVLDGGGHITKVNPAFVRITGYGEAEVQGRAMDTLGSRPEGAIFYEAMWKDLQANGEWQGEVWNRGKNGAVFPALLNAAAVRDERGVVIQYVLVFTDISSIKAAEARLTYMAHHDQLTGLPNRSLFTANLEQAIKSAKRHDKRVAVLLLDLDRFKMINDTLGHAAGDTLLQKIAARMRVCVRDEDTIARLGGDEFAVILSDVKAPQDVVGVADKIIGAVRQPVTIEGRLIVTSTSIGVGMFPDDAVNGADLVRAADAALYRAKARGRNTYDFHTPGLSGVASEALALESDLRLALSRNELELYYQPQFDLADRRLSGLEALLRWNHPTRGLMLPQQFIKVAEDSGMINEISEWVLNQAFAQAEEWDRRWHRMPQIAVNISGKQLHDGDLPGLIERLQARHANVRLRLEVELTEDVLLSLERGADTLRRLRNDGIMIAIDDFGTGYSSLSRLMHLPVDTLKIDKSFILALPGAADSRAITAAIVAMGHALGLRIVAEGVENQSQLDLLSELKCDEVQGFYLGKPMPAAAMDAVLAA